MTGINTRAIKDLLSGYKKIKIRTASERLKSQMRKNTFRYSGSEIIKIISAAIFIFLSTACYSQSYNPEVDSVEMSKDEIHLNLSKIIDSLVTKGFTESKSNLQDNQLIQIQNRSFILLNAEIQKAVLLLKQGIDYKAFSEGLEKYIAWKDKAVDGIIVNKYKVQTVRDLTTTLILLNEILSRTESRLEIIKENNTSLSGVQKKIDSLASDSVLYKIPGDTSSLKNYFGRLVMLDNDIEPVNSRLKSAIDSIQKLEVLGDIFKFSVKRDISEIEKVLKNEFDNLTTEEASVFDNNDSQRKSFSESIIYSLNKGILVLLFYLKNHFDIILIMLLFIAGLAIYLRALRIKFQKLNIIQDINAPLIIFSYPKAVATLIITTLFHFIFPMPPFIFTGLILIISSFALILIYRNSESRFEYLICLFFIFLNVLAIFDNLILIHTVTETWFISFLSILSGGFSLLIILNRKKIKEHLIIWIALLMFVFEIFSVLSMLNGYYNLSKILMTNGIYTALIGYLLIATFRLSKDIIIFSNYMKDRAEEKHPEEINIETHKITAGVGILFIAGWITIFSKNTFSVQSFIQPMLDAFSEPRKIGDVTFSYEGIFIFIFIIFMSAFIAKIVSFLSSESGIKSAGTKSSGLGSRLLLIRIAIILTGFLLAFAAIGIPIDKIAIIISALSVGIGFGLQTLTNNLVSGLILAFEKPININDIVEVGNQTGRMKSIGIRSSVVTTSDGADVIIPNGDLLNEHLINWTKGNTKRRFVIQTDVAYGTDLKIAQQLILEILKSNGNVLESPGPSVSVTEFKDSSINLSIKYWVSHFYLGNDVKSELLISIYNVFRENNIEIPFNQMDVNIQYENKTKNISESSYESDTE
jgi:small-conductance mechanosensitive channel